MPFLDTTSLGVLERPPVLRAKRNKLRVNDEGKRVDTQHREQKYNLDASNSFACLVRYFDVYPELGSAAIVANVFGVYDYRQGDFVLKSSAHCKRRAPLLLPLPKAGR